MAGMRRRLLVCPATWLSALPAVAQVLRAGIDTTALRRGIDAAESMYEYHGQRTLALVRNA